MNISCVLIPGIGLIPWSWATNFPFGSTWYLMIHIRRMDDAFIQKMLWMLMSVGAWVTSGTPVQWSVWKRKLLIPCDQSGSTRLWSFPKNDIVTLELFLRSSNYLCLQFAWGSPSSRRPAQQHFAAAYSKVMGHFISLMSFFECLSWSVGKWQRWWGGIMR